MAKLSPRAVARIAGVFEALEGFTSAFGQVIVLGRLVVSADAAATAANILAHQRLFWLGFVFSVMGVAFHLAWAFLFYELFKIVNRRVSLLAVFVILVCCAIQALTALLYLAPLLLLQSGNSFGPLTAAHVHALALVFIKLNGAAFNLDLVFFGLWCILTGYLIFRSSFLPRILGVILAIDGFGWALYVLPPLASHLFPFIAAASAVAEIPLQLWLIILGVNPQRWREQASAAAGA